MQAPVHDMEIMDRSSDEDSCWIDLPLQFQRPSDGHPVINATRAQGPKGPELQHETLPQRSTMKHRERGRNREKAHSARVVLVEDRRTPQAYRAFEKSGPEWALSAKRSLSTLSLFVDTITLVRATPTRTPRINMPLNYSKWDNLEVGTLLLLRAEALTDMPCPVIGRLGH